MENIKRRVLKKGVSIVHMRKSEGGYCGCVKIYLDVGDERERRVEMIPRFLVLCFGFYFRSYHSL